MTRKSSSSSAERVRRDIEDRGAWIAYEALLGIAQDPNAPAPARATAGVAVLRTGGLLDAAKKPARDTDPAEMDGSQLQQILGTLQAEADRIEAEMARRAEGRSDEPDGDGEELGIFD